LHLPRKARKLQERNSFIDEQVEHR
jgi:hypothetical protein